MSLGLVLYLWHYLKLMESIRHFYLQYPESQKHLSSLSLAETGSEEEEQVIFKYFTNNHHTYHNIQNNLCKFNTLYVTVANIVSSRVILSSHHQDLYRQSPNCPLSQSPLPPQPRPRPLQELTSVALQVSWPGWITQLPFTACQSNQRTKEPVQEENECQR